jgi:hypothetical protein
MKLRGGTWFEPLLSMAVLRDSLLLLLPPCFYIAKCNKRECCCIWLSGPGFQDLDKRTLGFSTSTDARTQQAKNPKKQIQKKYVRTDGRTDGRTDRRTDGQTNERTQRGVAESASQITGAECRVRQTDARRNLLQAHNINSIKFQGNSSPTSVISINDFFGHKECQSKCSCRIHFPEQKNPPLNTNPNPSFHKEYVRKCANEACSVVLWRKNGFKSSNFSQTYSIAYRSGKKILHSGFQKETKLQYRQVIGFFKQIL